MDEAVEFYINPRTYLEHKFVSTWNSKTKVYLDRAKRNFKDELSEKSESFNRYFSSLLRLVKDKGMKLAVSVFPVA